MMRNVFAGSLAALIAAIPGFSDIKITSTYTENGQTVETTIYGNSQRLRYDYGKGLVLLRQCDQKRMIQIDDVAKTYLSLPIEQAADPASPQAKVTDTGEQKQMFGHQARHLKAVQTANGGKERTETDGWYIDLKDRGACSGQDTATATRGYPLSYTITSTGENSKTASKVSMTVTALVTGPLNAALFEIPAGYTDSGAPRKAQSKANGTIRIGAVALRSKPDHQAQANNAYSHLLAQLQEAKFDIVPLADGSPDAVGQKAVDWQCDYVLYSELAGVEKAPTGKVGGFLHHAPGIGHVTGGDTFEARVDYRLLPVSGGSPLIATSASGKAGGQFNWKAAAGMASNFVPMMMVGKMMGGGGLLNPSMMNALASGHGYGASMTSMDPMMGGMSMFLRAANPMAGAALAGPQDPGAGDAAVASALAQEAQTIISKLKADGK